MITTWLLTIGVAASIIFGIFFKFLTPYFKKYRLYSSNTLSVLYKSENFIIVNKPYDIKINSNNKDEETVQTILRKIFPLVANEKLFHEFYYPHRLDYATSGILCIPIHKKACAVVSSAFHARQTKKYYIAIIGGLTSQEIINIDLPIGEDVNGKDVHKMCTINSGSCVKQRNATTAIIELEKGIYNNFPATKILARPITGRRHQIRTHCNSLGHTITGDFTYSNRKDVDPPRMFLHALRIVLPNSVENIDIETEDPFKCYKKWRTVQTTNDLSSAYVKLDTFVSLSINKTQ